MSERVCRCGERGETAWSCELFGHSPAHANRRWLTDAETSGIEVAATCNGLGITAEGIWFFDETGTSAYGPYDSTAEALEGLNAYALDVLG